MYAHTAPWWRAQSSVQKAAHHEHLEQRWSHSDASAEAHVAFE